MTIAKVLRAIEADEAIKVLLSKRTVKSDWITFTRTIFNLIAKKINNKVTQEVIKNPYLLNENLLIGEHKSEMLLNDLRFENNQELLAYIGDKETDRPFSWISGKSLQSYWSSGKPKELKINVLLTYLEIDIKEWDDWKYAVIEERTPISEKPNQQSDSYFNFSNSKTIKGRFLKNISNYYLGSYYLYYLKSDKQRKVVKATFVIYEDEKGEIIIKTTTEGQRYISYPAQKMGNALCVMGKNLDWEEIHEMHLFNIGLETNPEVIFGVSVTMTIYGGFPFALKNILIKQSKDVHFLDDVKEKDLNLDYKSSDEQEALALRYFNSHDTQIMFAEYGCSLEGFKETLNKPKTIGPESN